MGLTQFRLVESLWLGLLPATLAGAVMGGVVAIFMLAFFRRLRAAGRLAFVCLHPTEAYHLDIPRDLCERFVFVADGRAWDVGDFAGLTADARVRAYLAGAVAPAGAATF